MVVDRRHVPPIATTGNGAELSFRFPLAIFNLLKGLLPFRPELSCSIISWLSRKRKWQGNGGFLGHASTELTVGSVFLADAMKNSGGWWEPLHSSCV